MSCVLDVGLVHKNIPNTAGVAIFTMVYVLHVQYMDYKNGYHKDHPVIKLFWTVFYTLPLEAKKKFLGE